MVTSDTRPMTPEERALLPERLRARIVWPLRNLLLAAGCATCFVSFVLWAGTGIIFFVSRMLGGAQTKPSWIPIVLAAVIGGTACTAFILAFLAMIRQRRRVHERLRIYDSSPEVVETRWSGRLWFAITEDQHGEPHENPVDLFVSPGNDEPWIVVWGHGNHALKQLASAGRIVTTSDSYVIVDIELHSHAIQPRVLTAEFGDDCVDDSSQEEWSLVQVVPEKDVRPEHRNAVQAHLASMADML